MVEIHRVWLNVDTDANKITLFGRPRVSIRVDEYIWSLIEEHIMKPHKLMRSEKHKYLLKIAFGRFDSVRHRYYPFPASFEEQQYIGDSGKIHVYSWDGRQKTNLVGPYAVRELYLEHFGE